MANIKKIFLKKIPRIVELLENSSTEALLYNAVNNCADFFKLAYEYIPLSSFDIASDKLVELIDICNQNKSDFNDILIKYDEFICTFKAFFEDYKTDHPVKISFLLPTYNRAKVVEDCVKTILKYKGDNIEIICCDNASPDDTQQRLEAINDKRFKYFRNYENIGGNRNIVNVLTKASGDYCFYISDEDHLNINVINKITYIVNNNRNVGVITFVQGKQSMFNVDLIDNYALFPSGDISIKNLGLKSYMTGIVFKRGYADTQFLVQQSNLKNHGVLGTFPHEYIAMTACKYGKLIVSSDVGYEHKYEVKHPTTDADALFENAEPFYSVNCRIKMFEIQSTNLYHLVESKAIYYEIILDILNDYYNMILYGPFDDKTAEAQRIRITTFRNDILIHFSKFINDEELQFKFYNLILNTYLIFLCRIKN